MDADVGDLLQTTGETMAVARPVQQLVARTEYSIPVTEIRTVDSYLDDQVETERFLTTLLSVFGGIALLIGAVGIYGVTAHAVIQRFREFGIRRALGATGRSVLRLVLGRALVVVSLGTALGLGLRFS